MFGRFNTFLFLVETEGKQYYSCRWIIIRESKMLLSDLVTLIMLSNIAINFFVDFRAR